jgi:hypothetical protein
VGETFQERPHPLGIAGIKDNPFGTGLFFYLEKSGGDGIQGFIPGNGFKLSGASVPLSNKRGTNAILVINILSAGGTFGAEGPRVVGVFFRPFHLDDDPILDVGIDTAMGSGAADGTDRIPDLDPCLFSRQLAIGQALKVQSRIHTHGILNPSSFLEAISKMPNSIGW